MTAILRFLRSNAVGFLALFIALGGVGWAATRLPAGSVGTKQLRNGAVTNKKLANGSITPAKLSDKHIRGSIAMWARISATGTVIASKPRAQILGWNPGFASGSITWVGQALPPPCFALATVDNPSGTGFASVATQNELKAPSFVIFHTFNPAGQPVPEPVNVAVICP